MFLPKLLGLFDAFGILHNEVCFAHRYQPMLIRVDFAIYEVQGSVEQSLSNHGLAIVLVENCEHIQWPVEILLAAALAKF